MKIHLLLVMIPLLPISTSAQHWSPEEQSLIDAIEHCWERFAGEGTEAAFVEGCRPTHATTYWWTPELTPSAVVSEWSRGVRAAWNRNLLSQDLRAIRVQVSGDVGLIWFHGIRLWERDDGTRETESWRGFEAWQRSTDGWSFWGGMGDPDATNQVF
jgi:hypothetical protein